MKIKELLTGTGGHRGHFNKMQSRFFLYETIRKNKKKIKLLASNDNFFPTPKSMIEISWKTLR